jgi:curved DNA-binding protein CbpA
MNGINKMDKVEAYLILNIDSTELLTDILLKTKYRKACLKYHPDKPGGSSESFIKVKEAHDYLINEVVVEEPLHYYIQMLKNFNYSLVDSFIIEPIVNYLKRTTYDLNPTFK